MGKLVNVVLPGGRVVSVPEEVANKISGNDVAHQESLPEAAARSTSSLNEERSSGFIEGVKAAGEGFIDTATIGAYGRIRAAVDPNVRNSQIRSEERPGARIFGELAALLAPTGVLGKSAKAIGEALPITAAARAAGTTGTAGRLVEGSVYGVGGSITHANVSGDPLAIEGIVQDAGIGALLNFGLGKISDGLLGASKKGKAFVAAEDEADRALGLFNSTPESYNEVVAAHKATVQSAKAAQKQWDKAAADYQKEFQRLGSDPKELRGVIAQVDVMERKALNQITKGNRAMDMPMKSSPGSYATLSETDKAALNSVRKILSDGRVAATTAFKQGAYGISVNKLATAIEDAKSIIPDLDLPVLPSVTKFGDRPIIPDIVSLPKDLKGFAKLHPDTIAKLANSATPGSPLAQAIEKFTADVGLQGAATASATIAGTHATLNSMVNSLAKREAGGQTILDALRINSKRAVRYGTGRVVDQALGGGFIGASGRTVVGGMVGFGLGGIEGALIGSSLLNARARVKSTIAGIFARYGQGASKVVGTVAPITSYLKARFPGGEEDSESDIRKLALNRIEELRMVATGANDASFATVQPLLDQPGDIAYKIHATLVNTIGTLTGLAPMDPGLATNMFNSYWKPTHSEALRMAHAMEAALSPMQAIERLISGKSNPIAAEVLWNNWPAHMQEAAMELANNVEFLGNLTREQSSNLGKLFRIPLNGFQQPEVIAQLQSYFLPKSPVNESTPPSKMPTGNPTGRPPKVSSPSPNQSRVSQLQR